MKAAIIGSGNVGKAIFHDLQFVNKISEITLVGRNKKAVEAEVLDARDAAVLRETYAPKLYFGGYEALEGADIIIYTAGTSKMVKERMELLCRNGPAGGNNGGDPLERKQIKEKSRQCLLPRFCYWSE